MSRQIVIAGGGLAGLTLGILLRREDVPVEIWDTGRYPRHKVCGEFISGRGVELLTALGVTRSPIWRTYCAETFQMWSNGSSTGVRKLPRPALAISRWVLDDLLSREFVSCGGVLRENSRWIDSFDREGVVRATGRRLASEHGFIGLKVHARNVPLNADLELHFSDSGYVGLSRLPDGEVNICGLFREAKLSGLRQNYRAQIRSILSSQVQKSLDGGSLIESSFCAVAGISLQRQLAACSAECRLGDSICLIPPLTGNGMSLAIESAHLAFSTLLEYARSKVSWREACLRVSQECDRRFAFRLALSSLLQKAAFQKLSRRIMLSSLRTVPRLIDWCFYGTR
jgi:menaquinone-9 beta-reductase